jgi:predicted amidohydrolase
VKVAALQLDLAWEDKPANFAKAAEWIATATGAGARLVLLPEMFSCGFTMETSRVEERPDGPSTAFLVEQARARGAWVGGSIPVRFPGFDRPHNAFTLAGPTGELHCYRKIHPFTYAKEDRHYAAGDESVVVDVEGLRCALFVCYDLRFADLFWNLAERVDAYLVVANWPERRRAHWTSLLVARAIENQAYVVGVNRVGTGNGLVYTGDSRIVDAWGETLGHAAGVESMLLADLDAARVKEARTNFPVLLDRATR